MFLVNKLYVIFHIHRRRLILYSLIFLLVDSLDSQSRHIHCVDKNVPAIVIRVTIFMYEEQEGCVRLSNMASASFRVTTGTKQGSVLSPFMFSLYLDGLLKELRDLGFGCHVQGVWMGCAAFADDLVLLSPSRESMSKMLMVCEAYASKNNLVFSTDPDPKKSKTKCLYMCGSSAMNYPTRLTLNNRPLPFVPEALHLGHHLHQSCSLIYDVRAKKAQLINTSVEIRNDFSLRNHLKS